MLGKLSFGLLLVATCLTTEGALAQECAHDDALARVAAVLSLEDARPTPEEIARSLRSEGSDRVAAHVLWLDGESPARRSAWLRRLRARADADLVCGEARAADRVVLVAAERAGELRRGADPDGRIVAWLGPGFGDAYLAFRGADGRLARRALVASDLERGFVPPRDLERPAVVQLVATGPSGPRPVAERRLGHETGLPTTELQVGDSVPRAVAALRELRGVSPLRPNRLLGRVAQEHARRVCRAGRVVHQLAREGDPRERLRLAGIQARGVRRWRGPSPSARP
ncbi:MAG: hypothetical protein GXP55_20245 [Deltaproteobacteria bacterium]|nr:hypothetical protein [Deltaproteobacteria bacterium]